MKSLLLAVLIAFITLPVMAQEKETEHHHESHESHESHSHSGHKNHAAFFVGNTSQKEFEHNTFTVGADYTHFFSESGKWGLGVCTELLFDEHLEWIFCVPVVYKPTEHVWLRSGFGTEILREEHDSEQLRAEFLFRVGAGYDIKVGSLVISPSLDLDVIREHLAFVAGVNIGFGF